MDLHQMFSTAVADLPDLPDQVPAAERIHRRRTAVTRAGTVAAATALVVGVGTLTIASPWSSHPHSTTVSVAEASSTPPAPSPWSVGPSPAGTPPNAPALSGITLTGAKLSTSYTGHVTVIDVWGSWCTPCSAEAPYLSQAYLKYRSKGVQFIGLDERDDNAKALLFDHEFNIGYPSLRDPDGTLTKGLSPYVTADTVPSLVIVDPDGKMWMGIGGDATTTELDGVITDALAGSG